MIRIEDAAAMTMWLDAAASGRAAPDDVVAGLGSHRFAGWSHDEQPVALSVVAAELSRLGSAVRVVLALSVPGDPGPLVAGPDVVRPATLNGAAIVIAPLDVALVPQDGSTTWRVLPTDASRMPAPDRAEADRALRRGLREGVDELLALDVAAGRDRVDPDLLSRRRPALPDGLDPARVALLQTALELSTVLDAADLDDGAAVSASQQAARREVLRDLRAYVRRAVEAAAGTPALPR